MRKTNSFADTAATGRVVLDLGDGTTLDTDRQKTAWQKYTDDLGVALGVKVMDRGSLPAASSPDTYRMQRGVWTVPSAAVTGGTGWPEGFTQGVLVSYGHTGFQFAFGYGTNPIAVFRACTSAGSETWTPWESIRPGAGTASFIRGKFPDNSTPNAVRMEQGLWVVEPTAVTTGTDWPVDFTRGVLLSLGDVGHQIVMGGYGSGKQLALARFCTSAGQNLWTGWLDLLAAGGTAPAPVAPVTYYAEERTTRVADAVRRVGGRLGTGGKGVVMLRMDDYPDAFLSKVVPVLETHNLPCYWAATVNHVENLSTTSWATLNDTAVQSGVQMTGHSWSHGNATDQAGVYHELVESADYFEQMMPATRIDLWTQPSVGGAVPYDVGDGGYAGATPKDLYGTYAGRLLLSRYPVINGRAPGFYHPQGGGPDSVLLTANLTYEAMTFATFKGYVDEIAAGGYAADLMLHPGRLDTEGYMTSATFTECMAYLAQLRTEGRLLVLSGTAKMVLDPTVDYRHDLHPGDFTNGTTGGWSKGTVTNGVLVMNGVDQTVRSCHVDRYTGMRGSIREFRAVVRSTVANTIQLEAKALDGSFTVSKDYPIPGDGQWYEIRKFLTIPYGMAAGYVQFGVKSTAGAGFDVQQINAWAA